ncbi:MAG: integrase core domain-containing protein [Acidimicrobiia bacterium]|nr:integrase core domain-containing protein [Acidimicrobiia bacterium]MCY4433295.1 integrase core domain-containing protein [bacterium]
MPLPSLWGWAVGGWEKSVPCDFTSAVSVLDSLQCAMHSRFLPTTVHDVGLAGSPKTSLRFRQGSGLSGGATPVGSGLVMPGCLGAKSGHLTGSWFVEGIDFVDQPRLITDNGHCFKSARFTAWVASKRHIAHVLTRHRTPWTNGVIERFFEAIKYEHLYRRDIDNGIELTAEADSHQTTYNAVRPHQAIAMARPLDRYRQTPTTQPKEQETVSNSRHGTRWLEST